MRNTWDADLKYEHERLAAEFIAAVEAYLARVVQVDEAARRLGL
jgi:hypothetical protein